MSFWTTTKTALALVSIGILLTPALRKLGYLPPESDAAAADTDELPATDTQAGAQELSLPPSNGAADQDYSRH